MPYKATLTITGMPAYPVSAGALTTTGTTQPALTVTGIKDSTLTIAAQVTLTQVGGD